MLECLWEESIGVSEIPDKIPEHKRRMYSNVQVKVADDVRGDKGWKDLLETARASKVVNPLTRALTPLL
jgi:hypothetical protein